jgi:hypothetical protein
MKALKPFAALLFVIFSNSFVEAKQWRGIEPLHSTKTDVERLLGLKMVRCGTSSCIYEVGEETVFVLYAAEATCKNSDARNRWKVPAGTVIEIGIQFKNERELSDLGFDLSKFEKVEDKELPGWIYYLNLKEGIRIEGGLRTVSGVTYFQSANDNYLRCPASQ